MQLPHHTLAEGAVRSRDDGAPDDPQPRHGMVLLRGGVRGGEGAEHVREVDGTRKRVLPVAEQQLVHGEGEEQSEHHSRDGEGKRDYDEEEAKHWRPAIYSQG